MVSVGLGLGKWNIYFFKSRNELSVKEFRMHLLKNDLEELVKLKRVFLCVIGSFNTFPLRKVCVYNGREEMLGMH